MTHTVVFAATLPYSLTTGPLTYLIFKVNMNSDYTDKVTI